MPEPFTAAAAALSGVERKILDEAADRFQQIARESAARVVGYGGTMHVHGRGGRRRPVKLTTTAKPGHSAVFIEGVPAGMWRWIEDGTQPHQIPKRVSKKKPRFLKGDSYGHPIRGPIMHPGSRGQNAWTKAVNTFRAEYPDIVTAQVKKALDG